MDEESKGDALDFGVVVVDVVVDVVDLFEVVVVVVVVVFVVFVDEEECEVTEQDVTNDCSANTNLVMIMLLHSLENLPIINISFSIWNYFIYYSTIFTFLICFYAYLGWA